LSTGISGLMSTWLQAGTCSAASIQPLRAPAASEAASSSAGDRVPPYPRRFQRWSWLARSPAGVAWLAGVVLPVLAGPAWPDCVGLGSGFGLLGCVTVSALEPDPLASALPPIPPTPIGVSLIFDWRLVAPVAADQPQSQKGWWVSELCRTLCANCYTARIWPNSYKEPPNWLRQIIRPRTRAIETGCITMALTRPQKRSGSWKTPSWRSTVARS